MKMATSTICRKQVSVAYVTLKWTGKKYRKNGETSSLPIDQVPDTLLWKQSKCRQLPVLILPFNTDHD